VNTSVYLHSVTGYQYEACAELVYVDDDIAWENADRNECPFPVICIGNS